MKKFLWFATAALALGLILPNTGSSYDEAQIEKGRYLAEQDANSWLKERILETTR